MRLLLAGGGTGGHLFPAVAIAEELQRQDRAAEVCFVGTARGLEASLLPKLGLPLELVDMVGLVGRGVTGALQLPPKLLVSIRQALGIIKRFRPDIVIGVGGYASFPVLFAAWCKRIPIVLHEQNAQPGLSNLVLARVARRICLSIPGSGERMPQKKTVMTGNPLRQGVTEVAPQLPAEGKILVFGGSRGAHAINELLLQAMPLLRARGISAGVVHQTGAADEKMVVEGYKKAKVEAVEVVPFIDDMASAYAAARLVVCRAGATTIAELCACGRPAVLIPFPHAAADHQTANAVAMQHAGAVKMLPQAGLTAATLAETLTELWHDQKSLLAMAHSAASLGQKDAAARVLGVCRQILSEG